jgi:hypothetical protein
MGEDVPCGREALCFQAYATPAVLAGRARIDQLHPERFQRGDELDQRTLPRMFPLARLHALDGGQREARDLRELTLVDAEQGARLSAELRLSCFKHYFFNTYIDTRWQVHRYLLQKRMRMVDARPCMDIPPR